MYLQMIQRSENRLPRLADAGSKLSLSAGTEEAHASAGYVVRLPHGDVAADFKATGFHTGRERVATYELLVANDTPEPLATFAYAPDAGSRGRITWNTIVVPPYSAIAVEIDVTASRRHPRPRIVADLVSDTAQLTLDATQAPHDRRFPNRTSVAAIATALLVALGASAFAQARPRVLALAAPATVRGGTPFTVAYALDRENPGRYVVETPDGLQVRRGSLGRRSGAFTIALPHVKTSTGYDVHVWSTGRFGTDERTTHVVALPDLPTHHRAEGSIPASLAAPTIGDLALASDTVRGGEAIVATYRATTTTGIVRLIDALGTVRAEALLTPRGRSILLAPLVAADQDFRVVATVERGVTHAEAVAPVTVLHDAPPADTTQRARSITAPADAVPGTAPISVDRVQRAGRPIVIRIAAYRPGLHVALMGPSANEISGADVAPDATSVVLAAPSDPADAAYAIVATYASGLGEETVVRPLTFRDP